LIGYSDLDFAGCVETRKYSLGHVFLLARGAVSWKSAKQSIVATSSMEVEFVACFETTIQDNWLRNFVLALEIIDSIARPLKMYCDNCWTSGLRGRGELSLTKFPTNKF